jgi:nucleoid-associated protein YgaU
MNNEPIKEANAPGPSRLGKEAKIGVTLILVLTLVLGVVATLRFTRSAKDDAVASAEVQESGKERLDLENKFEATDKHGRKKIHSGNNDTAIVVTAAPASAKPSETTARDADLWKFATNKGDAKRSDSERPAIGSPPPLMPDPAKLHRHEHHDGDAADLPAGRYGEASGSLRDAGSEVRLVSPESTDTGVGRAEPSGFAIAESAAAPSHVHKEPSRYGDLSTPPPEPLPVQPQYPTGAGYSAPANPATSYGANDYRNNVSAEPAYHAREPRRPAGVSTLSSSPPPRDDGKYEVQPNDSYWTISERVYGTSAYFKALTAHNRDKGKSEESLKPGDLILAPPVAQLEQLYPDLCPKPSHREAQQTQSRALTVSTGHQYGGGRTYTVAEGDTLFNIARYELGKASRWVEIYELNRHVLGKDFNYLTPGIQLTLPEREKSDTLTRQANSTYR